MNKSNNETFITKAKERHGDTYDYRFVEYINQKDKIKIMCSVHGIFEQTPKSHLRGHGCLLCGRDKMVGKLTKSTSEFINQSNNIHNNRFDYSKVNYKSAHDNVKIICPIHDIFEQTPTNHLKGHGCTYCTYNNNNFDWFVDEANKIHDNKYDYSLVTYRNNKTKVIIKCEKHGNFEQSPDHHINRKQGCPICNESKGELEIRKLLNKKNIRYLSQYKFVDCKNKNQLPFDFYLPELNICIEYNGIQHYKPIKYFGGVTKLKEQQRNDKLKINYCDSNNIKLIIIRYNEKIEKKLELIKNV